MPGYWNRPEETAAALDDDGWYHSGDAAYVDEDGYLYIVDRVKDMIISGGENVYCDRGRERALPAPGGARGGGLRRPRRAVGRARPRRRRAASDGRGGRPRTSSSTHCRELIAGYKLPARRSTSTSEALPKSGAGKILKRELREPYWAGREERVS